MTSSTEHERHAEEVRARMAGTAEEIRNRMSPGQMVDEMFQYMRDSNGTETLSNLGRQVRDNPLPLALIGAGVAWFFAGPRPVRREYVPYPVDDGLGYDGDSAYYPDPYADDDIIGNSPYRAGAARTGAGGLGYLETGEDTGGSEGRSWSERAGSAASGASDKVKGSAHAASESAHNAAGSARSAAGSAASKASGAAHDAAHGISGAARGAANGVSGAAHSAADAASRAGGYAADAARRGGRYAGSAARGAGAYASDAGQYAADTGRRVGRGAERAAYRARDGLMDAVEREPLIVGAIGLALGAALGAMLPSTRYEDETFGKTRDDLADEAMRTARRGYEEAKDVAAESYAAARSTADEEGLTKAGDKPLAEKIGHVAASAGKTATDKTKEKAAAATETSKDAGSTGSSPASGKPLGTASTTSPAGTGKPV